MLATRALHLHVTPGALIAFLLLFGSIYVLGAPKNPESSLTPSRGDLVLSETIKPRALPFPPREKPEDSEDSEEPESEESEEPEDPKKPIDYAAVCRKGALANAYLQSDDETVLSDLLHKGRLPPGSQLASRFTDYAQLSSNGWDGNDDTERLDSLDLCEYIPFLDALQALGISTKPRTDGMLELWGYEHNLPWTRHDGKRVEPCGGDLAWFAFITSPTQGFLDIQAAYSTASAIKNSRTLSRAGCESPPLSHLSDIVFLDWQRACHDHNGNPKDLKHIFLSVVKEKETQDIVWEVFRQTAQPLRDWDALPAWENRNCFQAAEMSGQAIMGSLQLQGIMWLLLQHREQLGRKQVEKICIFKDDSPTDKGRGPTIYVELKDVW